jgi:hypothetical protein
VIASFSLESMVGLHALCLGISPRKNSYYLGGEDFEKQLTTSNHIWGLGISPRKIATT